MNRMRLKIAQRLKESQNTTAMLTTFNEVDMSSVMSLRKENQASVYLSWCLPEAELNSH